MARAEAETDPFDALSDEAAAIHTEPDRRDSYRYGVQGERGRGILQIGMAEIPVEIVDESASGFSVGFLEGPQCELNQTLLLKVAESWIEVRVMNVRTEHKLRDDGETLLRTRLGLKRIRELEEWEILQWETLRLAVIGESLRKLRLKALRRPLLTIVLPILGVLLAGAGVIWVLEASAPSIEDMAPVKSGARPRMATLHPPGELPASRAAGGAPRLRKTPELGTDQASRALRSADKINAKLKDKPVEGLKAVKEQIPTADRLRSDKQKKTRRAQRAGGVEEALEPDDREADPIRDTSASRAAGPNSADEAQPEPAAPVPAQTAAKKKKSVSTWELLLAPPVVRKLELTAEQIERFGKLKDSEKATPGEDLPFGFVRNAQGQLTPDPRVAEILTAEQLSLWQELLEKIEPHAEPSASSTETAPVESSASQPATANESR